ncbi:YbaN family protein [Arhodomonas sp. AD133]|uniref:YbaN family protein n=1 Tax=Arhodomonas sp. AD133 TaxID=3415009 RepID=UPI003EBE8A74
MAANPNQPAGRAWQRRAWQALAVGCVALGGIGVALPLVPTTPFVLLAAYAASRGSPALERWLREHPRLGPPLEDWHRNRAIRPAAKRTAIVLIIGSWVIMIMTVPSVTVRAAVTAVLIGVSVFIVTRPAR